MGCDAAAGWRDCELSRESQAPPSIPLLLLVVSAEADALSASSLPNLVCSLRSLLLAAGREGGREEEGEREPVVARHSCHVIIATSQGLGWSEGLSDRLCAYRTPPFKGV
jgi:hypothetical protein